jgi:hypothetical protein
VIMPERRLAWTLSPAGSSQLNGVSCAKATACTAVGFYTNSYAFYALQTLAEAK